MTCKYCQREIADGLEICPECGKRQEEREKPQKQEPRFKIAALIIGIVTVLVCLAAVIIVSLPMPQKDPAELFVDYDIEFQGYELVAIDDQEYRDYTYDYNADIYNRNNMVNVYFTLTNLSDHEVMLDQIDENDMEFYLWAQAEIEDRDELSEEELLEELDEHEFRSYDMRGNFYGSDNKIIRFFFNQRSLLPGESCDAVITMKNDINGGLNFFSAYVEVKYNDESFYWDLKDNVIPGVDLTDADYPDKEKLTEEAFDAKMEEYRKAQYDFANSGRTMF